MRIWNIKSGELLDILKLHQTSVYRLAVYRKSILVSGGWDGRIVLTDLRDTTRQTVLEDHFSRIQSIFLHEDTETLYSGAQDGSLHAWSLHADNYGKSMRSYSGHSSSVTQICFAPSINALLTASDDSTVRMWGLTNHHGKCIKPLHVPQSASNQLEGDYLRYPRHLRKSNEPQFLQSFRTQYGDLFGVLLSERLTILGTLLHPEIVTAEHCELVRLYITPCWK